MILSDFVNIEIVHKTNSFVSIKKLFALFTLYEKYEYISCIDSEIKFINNSSNYYDIMKKITTNKVVCAGKLQENATERSIVRDSLTILTNPEDHEKLRYLSHDFTIIYLVV